MFKIRYALITLALLASGSGQAMTFEEREALVAAHKAAQMQERAARIQMLQSVRPEGKLEVNYGTMLQCFDVWEQRTPYGFKAFGDTYSVSNEPGKGKLHVKGFVTDIYEKKTPFNFICALKDDLTIDRIRTYFSIRMDEQMRSLGYKNGAWNNPDLRTLLADSEKRDPR